MTFTESRTFLRKTISVDLLTSTGIFEKKMKTGGAYRQNQDENASQLRIGFTALALFQSSLALLLQQNVGWHG